jgi:hypothetical protein
MAFLNCGPDGSWYLDYDVEPEEFWPYTSMVTDAILSIPRKPSVVLLEKQLLDMFNEAGIKASIDNKTVYAVRDRDGRLWYLGFYDFGFYLGTGVKSDEWNKPSRKETINPDGSVTDSSGKVIGQKG